MPTVVHSLWESGVENWLVCSKLHFRGGCSVVFMKERPFLQKAGLQVAKLWTQMQMKHEVFSLADVSSLE